MPDKQQDKLLKRIANLVRQNQELENQVREITKKYEELAIKNNENERLIGKLSSRDEGIDNFKGKHRPIRFEMATILFSNIHGFSKLSEFKNSNALMDELDQIFLHFNNLAQKYNIQKIKTIGDAFMLAGGVPEKNITNPVEVVLAALEMNDFLYSFQQEKKISKDPFWDLTLGIHTGPVIANISGKKKISYDIKGDSVNIATRMESSVESNKVVISVMTYELVKEFFVCEYYGKMPVKYKNDLEMYEVKGIKPEFSVNGEGKVANEHFFVKYHLIQFTDIQEIMLNRLEKELPKNLYYHNVKHTVDVVTQTELIGWGEGVTDEEILLLKMAALFHDAGHIVNYDDHEFHATELVREYLPGFHFNPNQIEEICRLIMATKLPPDPKDKLERIMCDSDLDYLGRSDFIPVSNTLYKELKEQNKINSLNDWNKLQLKFISQHQYFTETAKSLREVNKQKQIERIRNLIK